MSMSSGCAAMILGPLVLAACSARSDNDAARTTGGGGSIREVLPDAESAGSSTPMSGSAGSERGLNVEAAAEGSPTDAALTNDTAQAVEPMGHGPGTLFKTRIDALGKPLDHGTFSLYVPDGVARLRGIIVHQHGCGRDGITVPHDLQWQALADKWGMALMGTEFPTLFPDGDHCDRWSNPANGSGDMFVRAIGNFATEAGHRELVDAPWVLWGHSGGAAWVFQMTKKYPDKAVATVMKSLCEPDTTADPSIAGVPMLMATGPQDLGTCYPSSTDTWKAARTKGAVWTYVDELDGTHDCAKLRLLVIPYLDAVIRLRLPPTAPASGPTQLRAVGTTDVWLGDLSTKKATAMAAFAGDPNAASWLPNEFVAGFWTQFVTTRTVKEQTLPTFVPANVLAKQEGSTVRLTWSAEADLESGIQSFDIYRDDQKIGSYKSAPGYFQIGNYGDEPDPDQPVMTFVDAGPAAGTHAYRIATVNWSGLASLKSDAATITVK
jgi:pimeloyl-ACP methyl ester carboxylesterase